MARKKDAKKREDWDDGRTIAPMTGDELPAARRAVYLERTKHGDEMRGTVKVSPTKEEKRALTRGMFIAMLPRLLVVLLGFGIAAVIAVLWLM